MNTTFNPHISVDCIVFGFDGKNLRVLVVSRDKSEESSKLKHGKIKLKLPGNLILEDEDLNDSAYRTLKELTGLDNVFLKQFGVFSNPERLSKDTDDLEWLCKLSHLPVKRVVTVAFYSLIRLNLSKPTKLSIDFNAQWYPVNQLPELIFDHNEIVKEGLSSLQKEILSEPLCFELLPKKFTMNQLQKIYEVVLDVELDNRNFRKKINQLEYLTPLDEKQTGVAHKPAKFYQFNRKKYFEKKKELIVF
jgi:8-oxo-dGTP diphosphatase